MVPSSRYRELDTSNDKVENFDIDQQLKLHRVNAKRFRDLKRRPGVVKEAVILYWSGPKDYLASKQQAAVEGASDESEASCVRLSTIS